MTSYGTTDATATSPDYLQLTQQTMELVSSLSNSFLRTFTYTLFQAMLQTANQHHFYTMLFSSQHGSFSNASHSPYFDAQSAGDAHAATQCVHQRVRVLHTSSTLLQPER